MPYYARRCKACSTRYWLLELNGATWNMDVKPGGDDSDLSCPECHSPEYECADIVNAANRGSGAVSYPYDDLVLGHVESLDHKRRLLRERGLEQADGAIDTAIAEHDKETSARLAREKEIAEDLEYQMKGPHKAEYRRAFDTINRMADQGDLDRYFRPRED